jgi:hypothetical protein
VPPIAGASGAGVVRPAYGYMSLPQSAPPHEEQRLRWAMLEYARLEGFALRRVFVDSRDDDDGA